MQLFLIGLVIALTGADHWTTYQCLRTPVDGWVVVEANPIADWLFQTAGLVPGLVIDSLATLAAIGVLATTHRLGDGLKAAFLTVVAAVTAYAVANNLTAMSDLGLL